MLTAYIALGSNLGNRFLNLKKARAHLAAEFTLTNVSPIYETPALMPEGAPKSWDIAFLNQVVEISIPPMDALEVLRIVKKIEKKCGREDAERWAPRVLDVDILDIQGTQHVSDNLTLPHAAMHSRAFVIKPLSDIAPDWRFPKGHSFAGKTALEVFSACETETIKPWRGINTQIMAIINVTPDSFSESAQSYTFTGAMKAIEAAVNAGADIIDIGAQSTRPNATFVSEEDEWRRLQPVMDALSADMVAGNIRVSLDSFQANVAARGLDYGVCMINDVSGLRCTRMRDLLARHQCDIVSMHSLGIPADKKMCLPAGSNVVDVLSDFTKSQKELCKKAGIDWARVTLDAGIGFGKTASQSLAILHSFSQKKCENEFWLIGHSRKSFMELFTNEPAAHRDDITLAFSALLMRSGVGFLRVHNAERHTALRNAIW